ncbi:DUF1007 family protein [Mesobaculum littorinae]|uniref:DUF1007 family protein n=1 Tax=Mesobaculum littorinae TaxID=2486419 RepID=A0A438AGS6_9RHOB|nr:DUF1007 family protein [Mesobaculum littorinae]RVV97909.1 DUF1007 family protein [Mesobaculum littorinae]
MFARLMTILTLSMGCAAPALAHPHIFIDTDFDLVFDASGALTGVRVEWSYDDFYSLLLVEEKELDADGDGVPEQDRLDAFAGKDVDWAAGFPGDFSVTLDGAEQVLRPPENHEAWWRDDRFVTSHIRPLAAPVAVEGHRIVARSYDPTYFVAYDVPNTPGVTGRDDCRLVRDAADRAAARAEYGDKLAAVDMAEDPFEVIELPDIGILFADAFELSCAAPS